MNITAGDAQNMNDMQSTLCVGTACLNASNSTLCIGNSCMTSSDFISARQVSSQVNATSLCAGGTCLNLADINTAKSLASTVNSTNLCIGTNCISPADLTNLKAAPQRINSSNVCVGSSCVGMAELESLKSLTTQHNATSLCLGLNCINSTDLGNLRSLPTRVNSTSFCVGNSCLNATDFSNVLAIPNSKAYGMLHLAMSSYYATTSWMPWNFQWGSRFSVSADKLSIIFQDPGYYAVAMKVNFNWGGTCNTSMSTWFYNGTAAAWSKLRTTDGGLQAYNGHTETGHSDLLDATADRLQWRFDFSYFNCSTDRVVLSGDLYSKMTLYRVA